MAIRCAAAKVIAFNAVPQTSLSNCGTTPRLYIAGSMTSKLVKIGSSKDPNNRLYIANLDGYGGVFNWRLLYSVHVPQGGKIETNVQSTLSLIKDG
jgi:hypothetical protein